MNDLSRRLLFNKAEEQKEFVFPQILKSDGNQDKSPRINISSATGMS